jgi:hypothetical protein
MFLVKNKDSALLQMAIGPCMMSAPAIIGGNFSVGLSHFTRLIKSEETQFVPS